MSRNWKRFASLAFGLAAVSVASAATTEWKTNAHGRVRIIAAADVAPRSGELWLGLQHETAPNWHVYWKNAGDAGYAPRLKWTGSRGLAGAPEFFWPAPTKFLLPGDLVAYGYQGEVVYPIRVRVAPGATVVHIAIDLDYLTCSEPCVPYRYTFTLDLPTDRVPRADPGARALIERFRARVPPPGTSDDLLMRNAPVERVREDSGAPSNAGGLAGMLVLALLGGLILNIMPCVLPVLSIKLLGLMHHGEHSRVQIVRGALLSAAGIEASFLGLAAVAIALRAAGHSVGWGTQFQNSAFVACLAVVVFLFALNLWGVFEIPLPRVVGHFATTYGRHETPAAHFFSGLFATLLATPCSAPFLGTAMAFALAQPPAVVVAIFAVSGAGMALPYAALAVFPASLGWLPRPGAWMVRVKAVLGAGLFATALWLGWVWTQQRQTHAPAAPSARAALRWEPFDEGAIPGILAQGRSVLVDITADWCFTCKYNERVVLGSPRVAAALHDRGIVLMQGDWTRQDARIAEFLRKNGRAGIPFAALYRPGKEPLLLPEFLTESLVLDALKKQ